jgi:hypothetical protein
MTIIPLEIFAVLFFSLSIPSSFTIKITSFDDYYSLRLPKIILDRNRVDGVFNEEKDSILKLTYERTGELLESYSVVPIRTNLSE